MKRIVNDTYVRDKTALEFDAFIPDSPVGSVVCIHGGGWISGDKSEMCDVALMFADRGFAAFCPQYSLAPLHPYPEAIEDIRAFIAHLRRSASELGIDPDRIATFGNSAGGYLSLTAAVAKDLESRANVCADVCGLTDLTQPQAQHPPISWDFIGQYIGVPYEGNEDLWIAASPLYQVDKDTAPTIIFHGDKDDIVWPEQSKKLYDVLNLNGVDSELHLLEGEGHSFTIGAFDEILSRSAEFFLKRFSN